MTGSLSENNSLSPQQDHVDRVVALAGACILAYLRQDKVGLCQKSTTFLRNLEMLWKQKNIDPQQVWAELDARITLSEDLLKRGIRARKGGPYRSTKLP